MPSVLTGANSGSARYFGRGDLVFGAAAAADEALAQPFKHANALAAAAARSKEIASDMQNRPRAIPPRPSRRRRTPRGRVPRRHRRDGDPKRLARDVDLAR